MVGEDANDEVDDAVEGVNDVASEDAGEVSEVASEDVNEEVDDADAILEISLLTELTSKLAHSSTGTAPVGFSVRAPLQWPWRKA